MCKIISKYFNCGFLFFPRISVGIVLLINIYCSLVFILFPDSYQWSFELAGDIGPYFIQTLGILFFMWNIPYMFAFFDPVKFRTSYLESILMQSIGLIGETLLVNSIPLHHSILRGSIFRFILFDGFGLFLLLLGFFSIKNVKENEISA